MFNDEELELTDAERAALAALPRERMPSDLLEGRVVNELKSRGLLSPASRRVTSGLRWSALVAGARGPTTGSTTPSVSQGCCR